MTTLAPDVDLTQATWLPICQLSDLTPERGAPAIIPDGEANGSPVRVQIAVFRLLADEVVTVAHLDPVTGSNVMARGLVGTRRIDDVEVPTLASPLHKQVYALRTGECLDLAGKVALEGEAVLRTWPTRVRDGVVEVALLSSAGVVKAA